MKVDVLVVGGSPAGIAAAISAASTGAETVLMDRSLGAFDHPANTLFQGMASRADLQIDDSWVLHTLKGMRVLTPRNYGVEIPAKGYFIDRERFDRDRIKVAEDLGVTLVEAKALDSRLIGNYRRVDTSAGEVDARVVIDASGVEATLATRAGLSTLRHPGDVAWAFEATVEFPGLGEETLFEYWIGSLAPGWKATFSPAGGDNATLGVFVRGHGRMVQPFFRNFLSHFKKYKAGIYGDMEKMRVLSVARGGDPIATIPKEVVADSLMVTGGAAGQSGIAYSMRAGEICGKVAGEAAVSREVSRKSLKRYGKLWASEFGQEYRLGRASLETLRSMTDGEIDHLVRNLSDRKLLYDGPVHKKALSASLTVALARPGLLPSLAKNLMMG